MAIIRKWLTPLEIVPKNLRYNDGTDRVQRSPDNGTTWVDDPGSDPRHNDAFRRPALAGTGHECDGAARIVAAFKDSLTVLVQSVTAAQFATGIGQLLLALTGGVGILLEIAFAVGNALISIGINEISLAFDDEVWEGIQCIISCHISENAQVTIEQRDAIMADIAEQYPGTVYNTLVNLVNLFGEVIMSDATVEYDDEGDCTGCGCGWCDNFRFLDDAYGWSNAPVGGSTYGSYSPGNGFVSQSVGIAEISWIYLPLSVPFTTFSATADFDGGGTDSAPTGYSALILRKDDLSEIASIVNPGPGIHTVEYIGAEISTPGIWVQQVSYNGGQVTIENVTLAGDGDDPELAPPCEA